MVGDGASSEAPRTGPLIGPATLLGVFGTRRTRQGVSLREIKNRDYTYGLIVTIVGFGLYSYYVRELLAALTLFSVAFFFLALVGLGALLVWYAGVQVAIWTTPA